ncbi:MAG TPA: hypothetical protein VFM97_00520 [Gammaproteobacteria bacterium]|nr:hypothetical protein [Gammaproteobacteria bacterium]
MKDRPIIFSGPMIRALLREIEKPGSGKTQTRRVVKLNLAGRVELRGHNWHCDDPEASRACPYGQPGDLLWCRETFGCYCHNSVQPIWGCELAYRATDEDHDYPLSGWRPSIHMPRWASRITLQLTDVRVQRVQDIGAPDAIAEGIDDPAVGQAVPDFARLWDSINEKRGFGWQSNPRVWALTFKPILANIDDVLAHPERHNIARAA